MTDRRLARPLVVAAALAVGLVVVAGVVPMFADARPAREIPAPTVDGNLSGPDADGWAEAPAADVPRSAAESGLPNADSVSTETIDAQAARSNGHLYLRLQWRDGQRTNRTDGPREFADAVAVQMPVNTSEQPAIAMGSASNLVNVWYWRADEGGEEILAGGPGSTTTVADSDLSANATYERGNWTVVFSRPLEVDGDNRTAVTGDSDLDVAFAVWNGSNMERSGRKAVSGWYYLPTGPGPNEAPFQTILWAIAGIAAVAVALFTLQGVRRARAGGAEE